MSSLDLPLQRTQWLSRWMMIAGMRIGMLACKFMLVIFISRVLDLASLGAFGLIAGIVAMAPGFVGLGLVHIIMRDAVAMAPAQITDALRHYWCCTVAVYIVALPISIIVANALGWPAAWVVLVVVAIAIFEHLGNDTFQLLTNLDRPVFAAFTAFVRGGFWILIYIPLAIHDPRLRSIEILLVFWLAGSVSSFAAFAIASRTWPWRDAFRQPFQLAWLASRVRSSLVVYASDISFIASQYVDRYLVTLFLGLKFAGVYMLYWTAANAMYTVVSMTVLQQQRPLMIKAHLGGDVSFRRLCVRLVRITALATAFFALLVGAAFEVVVPLLHQPLAAANMIGFWLIVAGLAAKCTADWGGLALFAARRDRIMTATNIAAAVAIALFQLTLLPVVGLSGAGLALIITFGALTCWRLHLVFWGTPDRS